MARERPVSTLVWIKNSGPLHGRSTDARHSHMDRQSDEAGDVGVGDAIGRKGLGWAGRRCARNDT